MKYDNRKIHLNIGTRKVCLRKTKADQEVFLATFYSGYHRLPFKLATNPVIVDLGCNIGLTIVDLKLTYPDAQVFGLEPDKDNYEQCLINTNNLSNVSIMQAAVWKSNGQTTYSGKDEQSYSLENSAAANKKICRSVTMKTFMSEKQIEKIDYLKMDIEGSEYAILLGSSDNDWLQNIKFINIEVHDTATINKEEGIKKIMSALASQNFIVLQSANHWASLIAFNKYFLPL